MPEWLGIPLAGIAGAAVTWLIDRRKTSGRIDTSDADKLWKEQADFRQAMRNELEARVRECKEEVRNIQRQNLELRIENHELRSDNMKLQFLTHPDIPQDVKDEFLEHQRIHVLKLKAALAESLERDAREMATDA